MHDDAPTPRPGDLLTCTAPGETLAESEDRDATACTELLHGEAVRVLALGDDAANLHVECLHDGYRGYVQADRLQRWHEVTHRVAVRGTLVFARDDIKSRVAMPLPFGARVAVDAGAGAGRDGFVRLSLGGWARAAHLAPIERATDRTPLAVAHEHFLGAPYLWGGRSPLGCDCSGLVQMTHAVCGITLPRDSGPQERALTRVDPHDAMAGDLVFWPGHVAFLVDERRVLHANAYSLTVRIEPLADVNARAGERNSVRRPRR